MQEYVIVDESNDEIWYVEKYSVGRGAVNLTSKIEEAERLPKSEADYVAEIFGMKILLST